VVAEASKELAEQPPVHYFAQDGWGNVYEHTDDNSGPALIGGCLALLCDAQAKSLRQQGEAIKESLISLSPGAKAAIYAKLMSEDKSLRNSTSQVPTAAPGKAAQAAEPKAQPKPNSQFSFEGEWHAGATTLTVTDKVLNHTTGRSSPYSIENGLIVVRWARGGSTTLHINADNPDVLTSETDQKASATWTRKKTEK
jgi:hypothetical protein